jgi:hypothetical protein
LGAKTSKAAAIHIAVSMQLASDGKDVSMIAKLGVTPPNTAGNAAEIAACSTEDNIRAFLANVAFRLRGDTPPLAFKWTALDPKKCLADQRYVSRPSQR